MINRRAAIGIAGAFVLALTAAPAVFAQGPFGNRNDHTIKHVLLISIDGMHALDFINCSQGITASTAALPIARTSPSSAERRELSRHLHVKALGFVSGFDGAGHAAVHHAPSARFTTSPMTVPRSAHDHHGQRCGRRDLHCRLRPNGTTTEFDEGIDLDQTKLNGGAPPALTAASPPSILAS